MRVLHIPIAIVIAGLLLSAHPGDSMAIPHCLSVVQHERLPIKLDDAGVDRILGNMSELLQRSDADDDVACEIEFIRCGDIPTLSSGEIPLLINSKQDFERLREAEGSIKVVANIRWCGRPGINIIGCADRPGRGLAVVRHTAAAESILWAHEFAHTSGNPHRDIAGALMRLFIGLDHKNVDAHECELMRRGSPVVHDQTVATPALPEPLEERLPAAAADSSSMLEEQTGDPEPIEVFTERAFFEGVPYNLAKLYSDEDVPILEKLLHVPSPLRNAVATLGAIGTEAAREVLVGFLFENRQAELSLPEYLAKLDVLVALGWLAHRSKDKEALELLIAATNEDWWTEEEIYWSTPIHRDREEFISSLVANAIIGLTLSGTEEAEIRLKQLQSGLDPDVPVAALSQDELETVISRLGRDAVSKVLSVSPATREAVLHAGGESFLESQLDDFQRVQQLGLSGYYGGH